MPDTIHGTYMDDKDLSSGLIRFHVRYHACQEPVFGAGIIEELARHGYRLSPGALYPLLHGLEERGYLSSSEEIGVRLLWIAWAHLEGISFFRCNGQSS